MAEAPVCECHGVPMVWRKRSDRLCGGSWRCPIATHEAQARWVAKNRRAKRETDLRYRWRKRNERDRGKVDALVRANPWVKEFIV